MLTPSSAPCWPAASPSSSRASASSCSSSTPRRSSACRPAGRRSARAGGARRCARAGCWPWQARCVPTEACRPQAGEAGPGGARAWRSAAMPACSCSFSDVCSATSWLRSSRSYQRSFRALSTCAGPSQRWRAEDAGCEVWCASPVGVRAVRGSHRQAQDLRVLAIGAAGRADRLGGAVALGPGLLVGDKLLANPARRPKR